VSQLSSSPITKLALNLTFGDKLARPAEFFVFLGGPDAYDLFRTNLSSIYRMTFHGSHTLAFV